MNSKSLIVLLQERGREVLHKDYPDECVLFWPKHYLELVNYPNAVLFQAVRRQLRDLLC